MYTYTLYISRKISQTFRGASTVITAAQSGLVDGKVLERAAGAFGDFLLHFLRKLLLEVRALVQVDQHQGDLVEVSHGDTSQIIHWWDFPPSSDKGVPPWLRKPPFVQNFPERRWSCTQTDLSFEQCSKPELAFDYNHHTRWFRTECRAHGL